MTDASAGHPAEPTSRDPREELAELVAAVRAYAEWQAETGSLGLPTEDAAGSVLSMLAVGDARAPAQPAARAPVGRDAPRAVAPATRPMPPMPAARPEPPARPPAPPPPPSAAAPPPPAPPRVAPTMPAAARAPAPAAPLPPPAAADERRTRLALIAEQVRSCTNCGLHQERKQTVFSRGDPFAELAFVGEGPGADEDAMGLPFVGAAGQLLDRMIAAMGYHRDAVYVCNIVKCRPPNNRKPEPEEMAACMPFLTQQLGLVRPKVIVALGATAVQGLCGTSEGITRMRGKWKLYKGTIPIMPTFHPAYLLRNPAAKREVWLDLQAVMKELGKAPPARG